MSTAGSEGNVSFFSFLVVLGYLGTVTDFTDLFVCFSFFIMRQNEHNLETREFFCRDR